LNGFFVALLTFENRLTEWGFHWPFGSSAVILAVKAHDSAKPLPGSG
jgi:hypothetical protein